MVASPTPVSAWLKHVPGARLQPGYWTSFASSGEFAPSPSPLELWPIRRPTRRAATAPRLLELSAGNGALWSAAVLRGSAARLAPEIVAGDLAPPRAKPRGVRTCAIDNTALLPYARRARRRWRDRRGFDVIYGSHLLCTCRWVLDPLAYASRDGDGTTCGGLRIERASVAAFVNGLSALLTPTGVAIFDQEGGWPFGLEALLHEAATARGLHLHVARGPLLTNFSYVLSKAPLHDDVARDPLQVSARAVDATLALAAGASLCLGAAVGAAGAGALPIEAAAALRHALHTLGTHSAPEARRLVATALGLRLALPFCGVRTLGDIADLPTRWRATDRSERPLYSRAPMR